MKKLIFTALSAALLLSLSACADKSASGATAKKSGNPMATDIKMDEAELDSKGAPIYTEEELGLRKENLYNENTVPVEAKYTTAAPGTAKTFERSYMNAPPLIPHSIEGLVPITKNNNACLGCHLPSVAPSVGATPIPPTHFMDFRTHKKLNHLAEQRYNCTQCHVPQANVQPLVKNIFKPDWTNPELKKKSNLIDVLNEGVQ